MSTVFKGDPATCGRWLGFAKNKAAAMQPDSVRVFTPHGVFIRIHKTKRTTSIYIEATKKLGYQFVVPFSYATGDVINQTNILFTQTAKKYASGDGVPYPNAPAAYGGRPTDGTPFMNVWWGEDGEYIACNTMNKRYCTGGFDQILNEPNKAWIYNEYPPVLFKDGEVTVFDQALLDTNALAGANVPDQNGAKKPVFVLWETTSSNGVDLILGTVQTDNTLSLSFHALPSWATPQGDDYMPPGFFCFNRQGTRLIATLSAIRSDPGPYDRFIHGAAEWAIELTTDEETGVSTPSVSPLWSDVDENGYDAYVAADYRWDGDIDTPVVVKLSSLLSDEDITDLGEYRYRHRMVSTYAAWHEMIGAAQQPAFRSLRVAHAPFMARIHYQPDDANELRFDGMIPDLFGTSGLGDWFDNISPPPTHVGISDSAVSDYHLNTYGYLYKFTTILALDIRADAFITSDEAKIQRTINDFQDIGTLNRRYDYKCFSDQGGEDVLFVQLAGGPSQTGAPPPPYASDLGYPSLNSSHAKHGSVDRMSQGGINTLCMTNLFMHIMQWGAAVDSDVLASSFIAIHPKGHWSAYATFPARYIFYRAFQTQNGFIGSDPNTRLIDIIKPNSGFSTSHREVLESIWSTVDAQGAIILPETDGYLAAAASGIWAI